MKEMATHIPEKMFDIVGVEPHLGSGMRGWFCRQAMGFGRQTSQKRQWDNAG